MKYGIFTGCPRKTLGHKAKVKVLKIFKMLFPKNVGYSKAFFFYETKKAMSTYIIRCLSYTSSKYW